MHLCFYFQTLSVFAQLCDAICANLITLLQHNLGSLYGPTLNFFAEAFRSFVPH